MAQVSLKKLTTRQGFRQLITNLATTLNRPCQILDHQGRVLWCWPETGQQVTPEASQTEGELGQTWERYPIVVDREVLGEVVGKPGVEIIGQVVCHAAQQEMEKRGLAIELLEKYQEIDLFQDVATEITANLDLAKVATLVVEEARRLIESTSGAILLFDPETGQIATLSALGPADRLLDLQKLASCILPRLSQRGEPEIIQDISQDDRLRDMGLKLQSLIAEPLKTQAQVIGAIMLGSEAAVAYTTTDLKRLNIFAAQAAVAIKNAHLYDQSCRAAAAAQEQAAQLQETLRELQHAQAQLIQSEKMSSLGQLVAGVAHEINNPVNFIYGNLAHASDYIRDLLQLLQHYQRILPHATPEIQAEVDEIDLEFLVDDLPKLLSSMKVGADRILEIVQSLRNFSRHDEAEMKPVNIHEGIESTLMILHNRLKPRGSRPSIKVEKCYGELPIVECFPGQLNQVFMNILVNAIDALEERDRGRTPAELEADPSRISISTEMLSPDWVVVRIRDNGPGMSAETLQRLYDPFFTTKAVGKGTGLGMAISHQIVVEKHRGVLKCRSQPGEGAEFWIQIPIHAGVLPQQSLGEQGAYGWVFSHGRESKVAHQAVPVQGLNLPINSNSNGYVESQSPSLKPRDLINRHQLFIRRLAHEAPTIANLTPDQLYQLFQSNPILLKLYLTLLN